MLENTNRIFNKTELNFPQVKTRSEISTPQPNDCVPAAVAHMGRNAPTYDVAIAKCDEMFPGWRINGGVPLDSIESFIEQYVQVRCYTNIAFSPRGRVSVPNLVMVFSSHAVNAHTIYNNGNASVIFYDDHSSSAISPSSFILLNELWCIYNFE